VLGSAIGLKKCTLIYDSKPRTISSKNAMASAIHTLVRSVFHQHLGVASWLDPQCTPEAGPAHSSWIPQTHEFKWQELLTQAIA